jgi:diguanylate cyclase (GGDEF)-like protein/PAS domain S-box-containing protein
MPVDLNTIYPKLINLLLDTVFVVDEHGVIVYVSDACEELLGYTAHEMIGTTIFDYVLPADRDATRAAAVSVTSGERQMNFENRYRHRDGRAVHILWSARWYEQDRVRVGVARDVTALKQAELHLRFLAHHDPLTGLTNRSLFSDRVETALHAADRHNTGLALLFLDLNDFKPINDQFGHEIGDQLLIQVARRLEKCTRDSDTVARMGGDEFTVLLTDIESYGNLATAIDKIRYTLAAPFQLGGRSVSVSCSIGTALYPEDGQTAGELLSCADGRMYDQKRVAQLATVGRPLKG